MHLLLQIFYRKRENKQNFVNTEFMNIFQGDILIVFK